MALQCLPQGFPVYPSFLNTLLSYFSQLALNAAHVRAPAASSNMLANDIFHISVKRHGLIAHLGSNVSRTESPCIMLRHLPILKRLLARSVPRIGEWMEEGHWQRCRRSVLRVLPQSGGKSNFLEEPP